MPPRRRKRAKGLARSYTAERTGDITIVALKKQGEHYVVLFDDEHRSDALRTLGRWASSQDLNFTWWDAVQCQSQIDGVLKHMISGKRI